jgi:hypothetical protein
MTPDGADRPTKTIVQSDVLDWLAQYRPDPRHAVVASLPDSSELPSPAVEPWKAWFALVVRRVVEAADPASPLFFYQSDVRHAGTWIDKGFLVQQAAQEAGAALLAHRIVCRRPAGTAAFGRATYSHLLLFSRTLRSTRRFASCDVIPDGGPAVWVRGIGLFACEAIVEMIRRESACDTLVHLFAGKGLLLEVAREQGLHAIGIDLSRRQCRQAKHFRLEKFRASLPGRLARGTTAEPPAGSS